MPGIELRGGDQQVELADTGAIELQGVATVWEDLQAPAYALQKGGVNDPDFGKIKDNGAGSTGVFAYLFSQTLEEELFFSFLLHHAYKEGTDVTPHLHWAPVDANVGTVRWGLEYTWANQLVVFGNTTLIYVEEAVNNNEDKHIRSDFAVIAGAGKVIASLLIGRVFRDATHLNDNYGSDAALFEMDIHYERDTMGSRQITVK